MTILAALEFPPISHVLEWTTLFGSGPLAFNKVALVNVFAVLCTFAIMIIGGKKGALVPKGIQNVAEASLDFVEHGIAEEVMGHNAKPFVPLLT